MIEFSNVSKRYQNGHDALKNVSIKIEQGEMFFLTGHSGAGKSTLLKLIARIELPTSGQIIINGKNVNRLRSFQVPYFRRSVGIIFQDHQLLFDRTVFDNVALPLVIAGLRHHDIKRRTQAALDKTGLLKKASLLPINLSGGEQQRVGIARAIVNKPPILLADEPTGNLDPELSKDIMSLFEQFNQVGVSVLIATHDVELAKSLNYNMLNLQDGHLQIGTDS